ncbi:MAG TPA: hypothetical protein PKH77_16030 [Anaerolineae bacterium]|nr:hypothetical protein [Anaerolineae bacterium]
MDRIVYPFQRTQLQTMQMVYGMLILAFAFPLICIMSFGSVLTVMAASRPGDIFPQGDLLLAVVCVTSVCGVGPLLCMGGVVYIGIGAIPQEAVLTSETFTFGFRGWTKTLQLAEIVRVSSSFRRRQHYAWKVTLEDVHHRRVQILIPRTWNPSKAADGIFDYPAIFRALGQNLPATVGKGAFDYRAIFRDLLQRLPATAMVDEAVRSFVATGDFASS